MFDEDKTSSIYDAKNNKLLMAYIFKSKKYISEFRQMNDGILELINSIGGNIFLIYLILFIINNIICERVEIRNFQWFLNSKKNSLIHRHINYEKNIFFSLKTDLSNDIIDKNNYTNTFKSTYFGNTIKNNLSNINNYTYDDMNQKVNNPDNNYTIKINKIETEEKEKNKNSKNSDNIIVINNNSYMNENTSNNVISSAAKKINNSFNLEDKIKQFENVKSYRKTYTYNKPPVESSQSGSKLKTIIKNNNLSTINQRKKSKISDSEAYNSKRKDFGDFNSKQKIIDTSTISLLNSTNPNKLQNLFINNSYNYGKKEKYFMPVSTIKNQNDYNFGSKYNQRVHISEKSLLRDINSLNYKNDIISHSPFKSKDKMNKITNITFDAKGRRKSHQHVIISNFNNIKEKDEKKGKEKNNKSVFLKLPEKHSERHLSLFSRQSNCNCIYPSEKIIDNKSQKNDKNVVEQIRKTSIIRRRLKKNYSSEIDSKNFRRFKNETKFAKIIQNYQLIPIYVWEYICLCKKSENSVNILNDFRKKLLSEEYLYILHINMFIFKQKYGCKSNYEHSLLLEELYNDY
jgi:hypothetical protein